MINYKRQHGITLIEVMVSVLVLSVGLLGYVSLQAQSIKSNKSAYYRSQANILAQDISERMRTNRFDVERGLYDIANEAVGTCKNTLSDNQSIAKKDILDWKNMLACLISDADTTRVSIQRQHSDLGNTVIIKITWDDSYGEIDSVNELEKMYTVEYRTDI